MARGAENRGLSVCGVRIVVAPPDAPPFLVEAEVLEEDTFLVLSASPAVIEPPGHPLRVLHAAHEAEPVPPGSVVVRTGHPLRLLAVVHDLARDPTWRPEWVETALVTALREARDRGVRALATPVLGAGHGRMPAEAFASMLRRALARQGPSNLRRIWLRTRGETDRLIGALRASLSPPGVVRRGPWPSSG